MSVHFENDYRQKILYQSFPEGLVLTSSKDLMSWRAAWTKALSSWHSPYKTVVNCSNLKVTNPELKKDIEVMLQFFSGFFLKTIVGYGFSEELGHAHIPFKIHPTDEEALAEIGLRKEKSNAAVTDFRGSISVQNHFKTHCVELTFSQPLIFDSKEKMHILRSKLTNNLMQWHSKWNLIIDCTNLEIAPEQHEEFAKMTKFFGGLFLKQVIGYNPKDAQISYPFKVFKARHKAAAVLESEGAFSGEDANCRSTKVSNPTK